METFLWFHVIVSCIGIAAKAILIARDEYPRVREPVPAAVDVITMLIGIAMLAWEVSLLRSLN